MRSADLKERGRAGLVPYFFDEDELFFHLMIPSDGKFGGKSPQIAKGKIDDGETEEQAAIREAEEEIGLVHLNLREIVKVDHFNIDTGEKQYKMTIYMGEIVDPEYFKRPGYETSWSGWLSAQETLNRVRADQKVIIEQIIRLIYG